MDGLGFDPDLVSRIMAEVAAREIMPRFRRLGKGDWREKSPGDIVTVADERAEAALAPRLIQLLSGSVLVGEEGAARDPSLLSRLAEGAPAWIVDPIDGTANYAAGNPDFCVMIALAKGDALLASWIHVPVTGLTAVAVAGKGARFNDRRIACLATRSSSEIAGIIAVGQRGGPDLVGRAQALRRESRQIKSSRCAGLDYLRLARGELDFTLFSGVMPWDHAPGVVLLQELGGTAGYVPNQEYRPSAAMKASGVLAARDTQTWQQVHGHLYPDSGWNTARQEWKER